ncbi:hypothetical protein [Fibrella aquatilis]|nr:hypothetical protein [Fibrella aquatilis]
MAQSVPMKHVLILSAASLLSLTAVAQNKAILLKEQGALDKAKTEIDANVAEPKLSGKSKTWYTRGQIYEAIAVDQKFNTLDSNAAMTAYDSYKKALEVEPNGGKMAKEINDALTGKMMYSAMMNQGVRKYQAKNYDAAYAAMSMAAQINPADTTAPMYAGISAQQAMNSKGEGANKGTYMTQTKEQFEKYGANGGRDATIWASLAQMYNNDKETDKALATLDKALKILPGNRDLSATRVSILQSSGRVDDAIASMKDYYDKNPTDVQSALNLAILYDNKATEYEKEAKKAMDAGKKGGQLSKKVADEKAVLETYNAEAARLAGAIKKQPKNADLKRQLTDLQTKVVDQKKKMADLDAQMKEEAAKGVDAGASQKSAADLTKKATETRELSKGYYNKVLATDPNSFEANFNLGVYYFNEGAEMKREVDNMSMADYTKNGKEVEGRVCGKFKQALPYFTKAKSIKADDSALNTSLEQLETILKQFEGKNIACVESK